MSDNVVKLKVSHNATTLETVYPLQTVGDLINVLKKLPRDTPIAGHNGPGGLLSKHVRTRSLSTWFHPGQWWLNSPLYDGDLERLKREGYQPVTVLQIY